ncbi:hypothetical protein D3C76_1244040 [compost metagenome]
MRLAVDGAQAAGIHQRGAVGDALFVEPLAEAAYDDDIQFAGQRLPQLQGRAIDGLGRRQRLVQVMEQVAALHQLRQYHDTGALQCGSANRALDQPAVVGEVTDLRRQLAAGDLDISASAQRASLPCIAFIVANLLHAGSWRECRVR